MTDNKRNDEFRHLFDVNNNDEEVNISELMTKQAEEGFESVPRDDNFQKFSENLHAGKEEIEETKVLFTPSEEKNKDVTPDVKTSSVEETKKVIQKSVAVPKETIEVEGIVEEDVEDNINANVFEADSSESEEKVMIDSQENNTSSEWHWTFKSPLPKLDKFYEEKKKLILSIVGDNILPFEDWRNELKDAKIDLADLQYDAKILCQTMVRIHEWKDRVQTMLIDVNGQFFLWHRFVDLLHGLLAHVAYEKPSDKFKGIIYLHMGDVERYFAELEGIREDIDGVMKNLDGAASLASRHLTLLAAMKQLPTKYADSYEDAPQIKEEHQNVPLERKQDSEEEKICGQYDSLHDKGSSEKSIKEEPVQLAKTLDWK